MCSSSSISTHLECYSCARPDILRSLLREGVLARIQPSLLGPYLKQRDDYNSRHLYRLVSQSEFGTLIVARRAWVGRGNVQGICDIRRSSSCCYHGLESINK